MFDMFSAKKRAEKRLQIERAKAERARIAALKREAAEKWWRAFVFRLKLMVGIPAGLLLAMAVWALATANRDYRESPPPAAAVAPISRSVDRTASHREEPTPTKREPDPKPEKKQAKNKPFKESKIETVIEAVVGKEYVHKKGKNIWRDKPSR